LLFAIRSDDDALELLAARRIGSEGSAGGREQA
jgi:hypothetical protein